MNLTKHAQIRCQQRGIPPLICEWLQQFGAEVRAHGATKRFFDRESRKQLASAFGAEVVDRMGDLLNLYLVESESVVITAGVRTRRIRRR